MPETRSATALDPGRVLDYCRNRWETDLLAELSAFIEARAISPAYDAAWEATGQLDAVADRAAQWIRAQGLAGAEVDVLREPGRTPLVLVDVPGTAPDTESGTVLFYGHLDKQPAGEGWSAGRDPWIPHFDGTRLYGRGGADDGYALYAAVAAIQAVDEQHAPRPRCVGIFETSEESGSPDLPFWLSRLESRIADVDLVVCLDSGAGDYDRLWLVTSLRGHCGGRLDVQVLDHGAHSGDAGGVVPSSFRIGRSLLDRLESSATGEVRLGAAWCPIPDERIRQARTAAGVLGPAVAARFDWSGSTVPTTADGAEQLLNRAWRPSLAVTGADGLPAIADAGNVLRPSTSLKLSLRLPPQVDSRAALRALKALLENDPPYGARVTFTPDTVVADGWSAPPLEPWLERTLDRASRGYFDGAGLAMLGQGGTIPLMGMLSGLFPDAQFLACGVQGPGAGAHGPDESLHLPYTQRLTASIAMVLAATRHE
ncbi:M20/M25/M40 family metallo-hydrolase [Nocardioides albus]|uniref:Acetylornithine deacetylase/succinyl-diaminopimelate desuccinylase-like protein n=1 Tax=Nocardioides albus TaxID=1841 RepID=A0A7W5A1F2_9ACTN|nr:M20/M25/M40 family metallo-hydrolase [Nocardioides albus]MBB3087887.1 acetylornithine deacetylase/succinyl-diaminopimelate desuccinylase-like protein [Nocardioides albus]GGU21044.1 peptidase [Nocardioides albus]